MRTTLTLEPDVAEQLERTFRTNIFGYFQMAKFSLPHMKPGGSIINTGSITGLEGNKQLLDYSSTKGAIHAFTKSLAQNVVERGIRVNCVAPGVIETDMTDEMFKEEALKMIPMKCFGKVEDIASTIGFLFSADAGYITRQVINVNGGMA